MYVCDPILDARLSLILFTNIFIREIGKQRLPIWYSRYSSVSTVTKCYAGLSTNIKSNEDDTIVVVSPDATTSISVFSGNLSGIE